MNRPAGNLCKASILSLLMGGLLLSRVDVGRGVRTLVVDVDVNRANNVAIDNSVRAVLTTGVRDALETCGGEDAVIS